MMPSSFRFAALRATFCLFVSLLTVSVAQGQELAKNTVKNPADSSEPTVNERVRVLEAELERQNAKLDQLQKTIADQQTAIQTLLERLSVAKSSPEAAEKPTTLAASTAEKETAAPSQTQTVDQRLAKVEGQALKIGPLRVSGDF